MAAIKKFDNGLVFSAPSDSIPDGAVVSNRGIAPGCVGSFKSRYGMNNLISTPPNANTIHSVTYFAGYFWYGSGTVLYKLSGGAATSIITGLSGNRLSFTIMPPTPGVEDYLFIFDGVVSYKVDSSGTVLAFGIAEPGSAITLANNIDATPTSLVNSTYHWRKHANRQNWQSASWVYSYGGSPPTYHYTASLDPYTSTLPDIIEFDHVVINYDTFPVCPSWSYSGAPYYVLTLTDWEPFTSRIPSGELSVYAGFLLGTNEYFVELDNFEDPQLSPPYAVYFNGVPAVEGTAGSLSIGEYAYTVVNNGGANFYSLVVRIDAGIIDPDAGGDDYITYIPTNLTIGSKTFQYAVTFKNSTTGSRSNPGQSYADILTTPTTLSITLSDIPQSADTQADKIEIWRTGPDGSLFFYLTEIASGVTTYTDDFTIDLSTTELPIDNDVPYQYFTDSLGPHNGSLFMITSNQSGQRGRVFYSAIGRSETMEGYIDVTNDSNPLQKLFQFAGQLGVVAQSGIWLIGGTNPYFAREIPGCPGTVSPQSVTSTPQGVYYLANDGIRLFDGSQSRSLTDNTISRLFHGEAFHDLTAFSNSLACAAFVRDEYIISDGVETIAIDLNGRCRDFGLGFDAFYVMKTTDKLYGAIGEYLHLALGDTAYLTDSGTAIPVILEPKHFEVAADVDIMLQHLMIDSNLHNETLTATLLLDDATVTLGTFTNNARTRLTIPVGRVGHNFGIRLTGSLTAARIDIYGIDFIFNTERTQ